MSFFQNTCKPEGIGGKIMVNMMNAGHSSMAEWGFTHIEIRHDYRCLDIGVGANCIYPIIGHVEYGWMFVGSDIDPISIENARKIVTCNPVLAHKIELRLQKDSRKIFEGIIAPDEYFDVTICNPPFHRSKEEAEEGTLRKLST